jgi:hypothetical protein
MVANSGPYSTLLRNNGGRCVRCCRWFVIDNSFAASGLDLRHAMQVTLMQMPWVPSGVAPYHVTCCWPSRCPIRTLCWLYSPQCSQVRDHSFTQQHHPLHNHCFASSSSLLLTRTHSASGLDCR